MYILKRISVFLFFLILWSLYSPVISQIIPENRSVQWMYAGNSNKPDYPSIINVLEHGLDNTGSINSSPIINRMIQELGDSLVLFFPEGEYLFEESIQMASHFIIRGEGPDKSRFIFNFEEDQSCFLIHGSSGGSYIRHSGIIHKKDKSIMLADASMFNKEDWIIISQENGDWDTSPANWAQRVTGQIFYITNIIGNTIFLEHSSRMGFDPIMDIRIEKINPIEGVGFEDFYIEEKKYNQGVGNNFSFSFAHNCRIHNIESNKSSGSHIAVHQSTKLELTHSYIHDAYEFNGKGTRGYGIYLSHQSGECKIENNIFKTLRHAMMVKAGANGNAFLYNYSIDPIRVEFPSNGSGDISLHGHYSFANLFEGNIVQNIIIDHYWGESGPLNTFFRNRAESYGFYMTTNPADNTKNTDSLNILGNEITSSLPFMGQFVLTGAGHLSYGNNIRGSINPVGTEDFDERSLYYSFCPLFWDINQSFPPIGPPAMINAGTIPAKERYQKIITGKKESIPLQEDFMLFPNPTVSEKAYLKAQKNIRAIYIYNETGTLIMQKEFDYEQKFMPFQVDKNGVYFIKVLFSDQSSQVRRLLKISRDR